MTEPTLNAPRQSSAVRNSLVITGVTAFAVLGYFAGFFLASLIVPDAANFYRQGGSIQTDRLDCFYAIWTLGVCAAGTVGGITGRGFYLAWQHQLGSPFKFN